MRLNIINSNNDTLAGFTNLVWPSDGKIEAAEGQIRELILNHTLSLLIYSPDNIGKIVKLVGTGGTISIIDNDLELLTKDFLSGKITLEQLNSLLLGRGQKSLYNLNFIVQLLQNNGFKITKKRIEGYEYSISAIRQQ